ncbi:hypothetical protein AAMO2058_000984500 [Amorphochlora amoebiformis]
MDPAALRQALKGRKAFVDAHSEKTTSIPAPPAALNAPKIVKADKKLSSNFFSGMFQDKSTTGYVGLKNQGNTCYLNSFIQTLYMTPLFRSEIYQWRFDPTKTKEKEHLSIAKSLQELFARLQLSDAGVVTTGGLTRSFGWTSRDAFVQQDVQEMFNVMFSAMESRCKATKLGDHISRDWYGLHDDYVYFPETDTGRSQEVPFRSVFLELKECKTLKDCFKRYLNPMVLDKSEGLRDANGVRQITHKGLRFKRLPRILACTLKRFDMDWRFGRRVKLHDAVYFPPEVDLSEFIGNPKVEGSQLKKGSLTYELYALLIHRGGASSGHYFAYIKSFEDGKWYCFDDNHVTKIDEKDVQKFLEHPDEKEKREKEAEAKRKAHKEATMKAMMDSSPSNSHPPPPTAPGIPPPLFRRANAYMIMYRLKTPGNINQVSEGDIEDKLREAISKENEEYAKKKAEWKKSQEMIEANVFFAGDFVKVCLHNSKSLGDVITAAVKDHVEHNKSESAKGLGAVKVENMRIREYDGFKKRGMRPLGANSISLKDAGVKKHQALYLEVKADGEDFEEFIPDQMSLALMTYDSKLDKIIGPTPVLVDEKGARGSQLRAAVAKLWKVDPEKVALIAQDPITGPKSQIQKKT